MPVVNRVLSVLLALAFLVLGVVVVVEIIANAVGHHGHALVAYQRPGRWLHGNAWDTRQVIAGLIVVGVIGLLLLLSQLKPRSPGLLVLHSDVENVTVAMPRRSLSRAISRVADAQVAGVSAATTQLGTRSVAVTAVTHLRDTTGLADQVQTAVSSFLDGLGLERTPAVRVSLDQRER